MKLAEQWRRIESELPPEWGSARLALHVADEAQRRRAAALLGPLNPGLAGEEIRFQASRRAAPGPEAIRRLLARADGERVRGVLRSLEVAAAEPVAAAPARTPTLASAWDAALAALPPDWSDLYCELEIASSDLLDRTALLLAPVNPARYKPKPAALRFRVARDFGYGAAAGMARRCLERVDEAGVPGTVTILRALSETDPNATQGPVWYLEGRAV